MCKVPMLFAETDDPRASPLETEVEATKSSIFNFSSVTGDVLQIDQVNMGGG